MEKRGIFFLGPQTMKILLSVISIAILVSLLAGFIFIVVIRDDKVGIDEVRPSFDEMVEVIRDLEIPEGEEQALQSFNLQGGSRWFFVGFSFEDDTKPASCEGACLCLCSHANPTTCQEEGLCESFGEIDLEVSGFAGKAVFPDPRTRRTLSQIDLVYSDAVLRCIYLKEGFHEISLAKGENFLRILDSSGGDWGTLTGSDLRCAV